MGIVIIELFKTNRVITNKIILEISPGYFWGRLARARNKPFWAVEATGEKEDSKTLKKERKTWKWDFWGIVKKRWGYIPRIWWRKRQIKDVAGRKRQWRWDDQLKLKQEKYKPVIANGRLIRQRSDWPGGRNQQISKEIYRTRSDIGWYPPATDRQGDQHPPIKHTNCSASINNRKFHAYSHQRSPRVRLSTPSRIIAIPWLYEGIQEEKIQRENSQSWWNCRIRR